ncbi:hypothetical protein [Heyndrickxia acidicola]|uniref:Uncharacterized protein n=1 Tax=Heyndrickxia acidicola TaxID=209389 RepID=A0ABU6MAR2_9BACI|nr:hypothetical protein [Heyndrickxia acidicola]MED1201760.1 hypothetical protein [Heyndrickxia acidicola]
MHNKTQSVLVALRGNYARYQKSMSVTQEMSIQIGIAQHELGNQLLNQFRQKYQSGE